MVGTVGAVLATVVVVLGGVGASAVGATATSRATVLPRALPAGSSGVATSRFDGLSCVAAGTCVTVGGSGDAPTGTQTLAATSAGGSWGIVPSPSPGGPLDDLLSVSCTAADHCLAAGTTSAGGLLGTLVERWDGAAWTVRPTPDVAGKETILNGISCAGPTSCVAVGAAWVQDIYDFETVVLRWDGVTWSMTTGVGPAVGGYLSDVSCVVPTSCTAVGWDNLGGTLVLSWDGTRWSQAASPGVSGSDNALYGVTCLTASDCVAVGDAVPASGRGATLVERWDGTTWSIEPTPPPPGAGDALNHVACTSAMACVAVGYRFAADGAQVTLVESWDGHTWSVVLSPSPGTWRSNLQSVVCTGPAACLAVGWYYMPVGDPGTPRTLVESWDGHSWSVVPSPNRDLLVQPVVGLAATPSGDGYWLADSAGDVVARGAVRVYGSMSGLPLAAPVTHVVGTPDGGGYWLVAADGGIFAFGDARFYGSMGGRPLAAPVVDLAPTTDGRGYWLVASDGGVFAFGDAVFAGSMGGRPLARPVVGVAGDPTTGGYWLVASDGGIFAFDAPFLGSTGATVLARPVAGVAASTNGGGYRLVATDGGVFAFGDAAFRGSMGGLPLAAPVVGMAGDPTTGGYWLGAADGGVFSFDAPYLGAG